TDNKNVPDKETMAIRYKGGTPFPSDPRLVPGKVFPVQNPMSSLMNNLPADQQLHVELPSHEKGIHQIDPAGGRTTFRFECGHAKLTDPDGSFKAWFGTPGGASGSPGDPP